MRTTYRDEHATPDEIERALGTRSWCVATRRTPKLAELYDVILTQRRYDELTARILAARPPSPPDRA